MRMSITQVGTNLINEIIEYLTQGGGSLPFVELERCLTTKVQACVCNIMSRYIEEINHKIVSDKVDRRRAGFSVERHNDKRQMLTTFGEVCYVRTYFANKDGTYAYLADRAVGVESYTRVSEGVSVSLAKAAGEVTLCC